MRVIVSPIAASPPWALPSLGVKITLCPESFMSLINKSSFPANLNSDLDKNSLLSGDPGRIQNVLLKSAVVAKQKKKKPSKVLNLYQKQPRLTYLLRLKGLSSPL